MQAASGAGKDNGGISAETGGGGKAQQEGAGIGVVSPGNQPRDWRDGGEQEIELAEELFVLLAKGCVTLPKVLDCMVGERGTPFESCGYNGVEFLEETGVELRGFVGL